MCLSKLLQGPTPASLLESGYGWKVVDKSTFKERICSMYNHSGYNVVGYWTRLESPFGLAHIRSTHPDFHIPNLPEDAYPTGFHIFRTYEGAVKYNDASGSLLYSIVQVMWRGALAKGLQDDWSVIVALECEEINMANWGWGQ